MRPVSYGVVPDRSTSRGDWALTSGSSESITINGCPVHIRRGGEGPPLLYLHGSGGITGWLPFMATLARRYSVIVPDHPGFGRSGRPDWLDEISDLAYFYLDFIQALDLDHVHLVGHSLGGWIAAELAVRNTHRLKTLTLAAAAGIHVNGLPKGDLFLWQPEERIRNLYVDQRLAEKHLAEQISDQDIDIQLNNELTAADLGWNPRFHNPHLRKWLHRIDVPTLIVWGDDDKVFPLGYGEEYRSLIPNSRLKVLPSCGHLPQIEKAAEFVDTFDSFAAEHAS
jgi:pimeloyl-ACP methyl ester carboxylesterase